MSEASCKPDPDSLESERGYIDEHAESLTDLIDVLQRQSFTRRFELRVSQSGGEGDAASTSVAPRLLSRRSR